MRTRRCRCARRGLRSGARVRRRGADARPGVAQHPADAHVDRSSWSLLSVRGRRRIPTRPGRSSALDHQAHEDAFDQQSQQPDRGCLSGRNHRPTDRDRAAPQPVASQRRVLRPDHSRRYMDESREPCPGRSAHSQRLHVLEVLLDDRMADRLRDRIGRAHRYRDQGPRVQLLVRFHHHTGRGGGGAGRATGLRRRDGRRLPAPPQRSGGHPA